MALKRLNLDAQRRRGNVQSAGSTRNVTGGDGFTEVSKLAKRKAHSSAFRVEGDAVWAMKLRLKRRSLGALL